MRLNIYDSHAKTLGGGENYICALAKALNAEHEVSLAVELWVGELLRERFGTDEIRLTPAIPKDANIIITNDFPYGKKLAYIIQIPYTRHPAGFFVKALLRGRVLYVKRLLRQRLMLRDARRSSFVLTYSQFLADHLKRDYRIDAAVLPPPAEDYQSPLPKKPYILNVGRFFRRGYNAKRHDVLITAFKRFTKLSPGWELHLVGGASRGCEEYLGELLLQSPVYGVRFFPNATKTELAQHYAESTFFWHATGYGTTQIEEMDPCIAIGTLEAMSAGCVPLVIPNGGQKSVLTKWDAARFWETPEDLASLTHKLIQNPNELALLRANARRCYEEFTFEKFKEKALTIFRDHPLGIHGQWESSTWV